MREPHTIQEQRNAHLHPLLSHNSSTLKEVSFTSKLSERAYYAEDHVVNGISIFPGAAFLEIACISGSIAGEQSIARIRDIVWIQPLSFEHGPQSLRTYLKYIGDSAEFAIASLDEEHDRVVHSEGRLYFKDSERNRAHIEETVALEKLKGLATSVQGRKAFYEKFAKNGIRYGDSFQSVQEIHVGKSWVLSHLTVAHSLLEDFGHYILHPSIIDGALQTVAGFFSGADAEIPHLPFALDEVDIVRAIHHDCYAYVELSDSEGPTRTDVKKFNIRLLNERGDVLVKLKNLYVRALGKATTTHPSPLSGRPT
jgi:acyl transferase domain-containing protein